MKNIFLVFILVAPFCLFGQTPLTEEQTLAIVKQALEDESKIELGTFRLKVTTIDKSDMNDIKFYSDIKIYDDSKDIDSENGKTSLKIISVAIDIRDGSIYDVRITADDKGTNLLFTNERPFALSHFNRPGKWRLYNVDRSHKKENIDLKSILEYDYKTGENFVIDKAIVNLDADNEFQKTVMANNNLKTLIDFRIYSDFLGILNEQANGIISFEASSTFFIFPKAIDVIKRDQGYFYLFKRVKPFINYSRFDNDDRTINTSDFNLDDINNLPDGVLSLVQTSFIKAGGELDLFEWEPTKFSSVKFYGKARAGLFVTEMGNTESITIDMMDETTPETNQENTTTLSWGLGVGVASKRYSNFGISASAFWDRYENNNIGPSGSGFNFNTLSFNSEAYFYTANNSDNAVFLRLNYTQGQNEISSSANFFSIQFGYRAELKINNN